MDHGIVSLFPSLFTYQFLVIGVLRMAAGLLAISAGYRHLARRATNNPPQSRDGKAVVQTAGGTALVIAGILFVVGLYTQGAAIALSILWTSAATISLKRREPFLRFSAIYFFIALVSLSFLFLGPGAFAIDLPL
ncbi:MAG: hypothetical protein ACYC8S_03760 [Minisyncoccota bacterium]